MTETAESQTEIFCCSPFKTRCSNNQNDSNVVHKKFCFSFEYGAMDVKNHLVVQKKKKKKENEWKKIFQGK